MQRAQTEKPDSPSVGPLQGSTLQQVRAGATTEPNHRNQSMDEHLDGVQTQSAGVHRSQSFQARPRTCTSQQIKTWAAGALRSNPFLQQSRCSGGNTAAPTASEPHQPCTAQRPLHTGCSRECREKKKSSRILKSLDFLTWGGSSYPFANRQNNI